MKHNDDKSILSGADVPADSFGDGTADTERHKSYRTAARRGITEYLMENADRSVTVGDIMNGLKKDSLDINASTVYRYLSRLTEEGLVNKYMSERGDSALYQYAGKARCCSEHLHLQCKNCGRVIHLDCDFMDEITEHIMEHHGFEIVCRGSVLYGLCDRCR